MPGNRTHDAIVIGAMIPLAPILYEAVGPHLTLVALGGWLISGLFLSPDLDLPSAPMGRWGPLRIIWIPYQHLVTHRSWLSHGPIAGTVIRLAWVAICLCPVAVVLMGKGTVTPEIAKAWLHAHRPEVWAALAGAEGAAMAHSLADIFLKGA